MGAFTTKQVFVDERTHTVGGTYTYTVPANTQLILKRALFDYTVTSGTCVITTNLVIGGKTFVLLVNSVTATGTLSLADGAKAAGTSATPMPLDNVVLNTGDTITHTWTYGGQGSERLAIFGIVETV